MVAVALVVAVVDSGVMSAHPSLKGRLLPGADMVSDPFSRRGGRSNNAEPDERMAHCSKGRPVAQYRTHGTEVASVLVGNGVGGAYGVASEAMVLPVRVMSACGMNRKDLIDAMVWAGGLQVADMPLNQHPAKVVNVSLTGGRTTCGADMQGAIDALVAEGVFVVAAAGNTFGAPLKEPANCKGVISVGAVNQKNEVTAYTALDARTTVYAMGGETKRGEDGRRIQAGLTVASFALSSNGNEQASVHDRGVGTSFAAPLVAGFIANWLTQEPSLKPQDFVDQLHHITQAAVSTTACTSCQPRVLKLN